MTTGALRLPNLYTSALGVNYLPRNYLSLCTMCKVVNELVYFPHHVFVPRTTTLRSLSKLLYHQPFAHTNAFLCSFVPQTCSAWNDLPDYIAHANTLSVFKSSPSNYMYHVNSQ